MKKSIIALLVVAFLVSVVPVEAALPDVDYVNTLPKANFYFILGMTTSKEEMLNNYIHLRYILPDLEFKEMKVHNSQPNSKIFNEVVRTLFFLDKVRIQEIVKSHANFQLRFKFSYNGVSVNKEWLAYHLVDNFYSKGYVLEAILFDGIDGEIKIKTVEEGVDFAGTIYGNVLVSKDGESKIFKIDLTVRDKLVIGLTFMEVDLGK